MTVPDPVRPPAPAGAPPRSRRHRLLTTGTVVAVLLAAAALTWSLQRGTGSGSASGAGAGGTVRYVTPDGSGSGRSWDAAAGLADVPRLVEQLPEGGRVLLRADEGPYRVTGPVVLTSGGAAGAPVVVRGVTADGTPATAELRGDRADPYDPHGPTGHDAFWLDAGADHLAFDHLALHDVGNAFLARADVSDIAVTASAGTDVRRFFEDARAGGEDSADVSGLVLRDITVTGFSKRVLRLRYGSHDVLVEDVRGDSQQQDGDDFAIGVHLEGEVHDVVLRRVTMRGTRDSLHGYWNGDGFATERGVHDIRFEDTTSAGNTDAGYDLKSSRTALVRAVASDNKRNFRLWGDDVTATDCQGRDPHRRGGSGSQVQVWLGEGAQVRLEGCAFRDDDPATVVFDTEPHARVVVDGGSLQHAGELRRLSTGASVDLRGVRR